MKLEVCANSFQSAKNAQSAGAHRIELCQELHIGGITPSFGLLSKVLDELKIETFVLIRPRSGGFFYTDEEFEVMKQDIIQCKKMGCHGIVSGVLLRNGNIDLDRTKQLVKLSNPLPFTFHRAFDCVPDPLKAIKELKTMGLTRVLTSGQQLSAFKGLQLLKQLHYLSDDKIIILPGGGINKENAITFKQAGFLEIHASASVLMPSPKASNQFNKVQQTQSDIKLIEALLKQIQ